MAYHTVQLVISGLALNAGLQAQFSVRREKMSSFANDRLILLLGLTGFLVALRCYRLQSRPIMAQAEQVQGLWLFVP